MSACGATVWGAHEERPESSSRLDSEKWKRGLTGEIALRVRDLIGQIAAEDELTIVCGKVARDHIHEFISYARRRESGQIMQWFEGTSRECRCENTHTCVSSSRVVICGRRDTGGGSGTVSDRMIEKCVDEQEGEQIADDSQF